MGVTPQWCSKTLPGHAGSPMIDACGLSRWSCNCQVRAAQGHHDYTDAPSSEACWEMSAHPLLWVPELAARPDSGDLDGLHVPLLVVQGVVRGGAGGIHAHFEVRLAHRDLCMPAHAAFIKWVGAGAPYTLQSSACLHMPRSAESWAQLQHTHCRALYAGTCCNSADASAQAQLSQCVHCMPAHAALRVLKCAGAASTYCLKHASTPSGQGESRVACSGVWLALSLHSGPECWHDTLQGC